MLTTLLVSRLTGGIIDAATHGAVGVITILAHIVVCLLAFVSLLTLVNAVLVWLGQRVGLELISLEVSGLAKHWLSF